jgi:hypothetical protein
LVSKRVQEKTIRVVQSNKLTISNYHDKYIIWIGPLLQLKSLVGAAISFVTALVIHIHLGKTIVAIALAGVLIFGGFLLRSFGRGKEEGGIQNQSIQNNTD